jgi:hypothetical protein
MHEFHRPKLLVAVALVLLVPACSSNTPTITDVPRAAITVTVDPNPITATQNPLTLEGTASYKVVVTETAGLGGKLNFVSSSVYDPATGLQVALNYFDSQDLLVFVGSDRIEPSGTVSISQTTTYLLPDLSIAATLSVAVQMTDDRGSLLNASVLVPIQAPAAQ